MNPLLIAPLLDVAGKVFDRIFPDKTEADRAKMQFFEAARSDDVKLALEQIKVNAEEAKNPSLWVSGWRPAVGWSCAAGLFWNFLGYPMASWFIEIFKPEFTAPPLLSDNLMELTLAMLGMAGLRSWEKFKQNARD